MQGTKPQFKTAGLLFKMFRVDRIQDKGTIQGVQVQQVMGELRTELGMVQVQLVMGKLRTELGMVQVQLVMGKLRTELGMQIQVKQDRLNVTTATENGTALDEEQLLFIAGGQDNAVDEDVDEQPVQDLALTVDNVFQDDDCDAFVSNVDE
ncbi:hypothetical protein Tco_0899510, partial [Tanacetum coccineum]